MPISDGDAQAAAILMQAQVLKARQVLQKRAEQRCGMATAARRRR